LVVDAYVFNAEDSQSHGTFHVMTIFRPSILDNQEYLKFFENDENISGFLTDNDSMISNDLE
jgi:hypothetical protein